MQSPRSEPPARAGALLCHFLALRTGETAHPLWPRLPRCKRTRVQSDPPEQQVSRQWHSGPSLSIQRKKDLLEVTGRSQAGPGRNWPSYRSR